MRPPWPKGVSGNPEGRPKGTGLTDRLREIVAANDGAVGKELIDTAVKFANKGDWRFWNSIIERVEGKVPDKVEGDGKLEIVIRHVKKPLNNDDSDA